MRHRNLVVTAALVGVLSLIASACSNDDDTGGGGGGTPTGGAEAGCDAEFGCVTYEEGEPIVIGTLLAISGEVATLGQDSQNGAKLGIDYLDGNFDATPGQLLGHDVKLQNEDDLCAKEGGQKGGTKLANDPTVLAVIGTSCSSSALGVADTILSEKGILLVSPSNTAADLTAESTHQPFYARTAQNDAIQAKVVSDFVSQELGFTSAATIHDESPYAAGLTNGFADFFTAAGGTITSEEQITSTDTDFKPVLTGIAATSPELIYLPDFNPACALIAKQALDIPELDGVALMGSDGCLTSTFLDQAGDAAEGFYMSGPVPAPGCPEACDLLKQFNDAYDEQFGEPTASFNVNAFDAFTILSDAIKEVAIQNDDGSIDIPRLALRDALFATSGHQGITGDITCNEYGDCQSTTKVNIAVYQSPEIPVKGGNLNAKSLFNEELSLQEVIG